MIRYPAQNTSFNCWKAWSIRLEYDALSKALWTKAQADEDRSGKHIKYYVEIRGIRRLVTVMSHGARGQISKRLLASIARQMRLSSRQLQHFVDCTLSRDDWLHLWENSLQKG